MNNLQGNLSTILVWIYCIIAPYIAQYMSQDQFVTIMTALVGLIVAIWSAYNPNSFKFSKNSSNTCCTPLVYSISSPRLVLCTTIYNDFIVNGEVG